VCKPTERLRVSEEMAEPAWAELLWNLCCIENGLTEEEVGIATVELLKWPVEERNFVLSLSKRSAVAAILHLIGKDRLCRPANLAPATSEASCQLLPGMMLARAALEWLERSGLYPISPRDTSRSDQQPLLQKKID